MYRKGAHQWKLDWPTLFHHFMTCIGVTLRLPNPEYFIYYLGVILLCETSTIFLNLQAISKFLDLGKRSRKYCEFGFLLTWMLGACSDLHLLSHLLRGKVPLRDNWSRATPSHCALRCRLLWQCCAEHGMDPASLT